MADDRTVLEGELFALAERRFVDSLEILLDSTRVVAPLRAHLRSEAKAWARDLLGDDDASAVRTASRLLSVMFDADEFSPPDAWWLTAFGRIVALRIGYPGRATLSGVEAAAMLGISRQGVHDLVRRGKLATAEDGRVLTTSVQDRLALVNRQEIG